MKIGERNLGVFWIIFHIYSIVHVRRLVSVFIMQLPSINKDLGLWRLIYAIFHEYYPKAINQLDVLFSWWLPANQAYAHKYDNHKQARCCVLQYRTINIINQPKIRRIVDYEH